MKFKVMYEPRSKFGLFRDLLQKGFYVQNFLDRGCVVTVTPSRVRQDEQKERNTQVCPLSLIQRVVV